MGTDCGMECRKRKEQRKDQGNNVITLVIEKTGIPHGRQKPDNKSLKPSGRNQSPRRRAKRGVAGGGDGGCISLDVNYTFSRGSPSSLWNE